MKRTAILLTLLSAMCLSTFAQVDEKAYQEWAKSQREKQTQYGIERNQKLDAMRKQYDAFLKERDAAFAKYLKQRWEKFNPEAGVVPPEDPKPVSAPVAPAKVESLENLLEELEAEIEPQEEEQPAVEELPTPRYTKNVTTATATLRDRYTERVIDYYGIQLTFHPDPKMMHSLTTVNETGIANYWATACRADYDLFLDELFLTKLQFSLNDWGYYTLVKHCADSWFTKENDRQLFTWFILNKSGYVAAVGYSDRDLSILIPARQELYGIPYITQTGLNYYVIKPLDKIYTYTEQFPGSTRVMDLSFEEPVSFPDDRIMTRRISFLGDTLNLKFNRHLIEFYNEYPLTELSVYFNAPMSPVTSRSVVEELSALLADNPTQKAQVQNLMTMMHKGFPYQIDEEQFGQEKYFFPEETLFYPYSDCEDRSVFFTSVVKKLIGLSSVGLCYPGHVASAIHFDTGVSGSYLKYRETSYFVCDPTYIGSSVGMSMPSMANQPVEIIPLKNATLSREREDTILAMIEQVGGMIINFDKSVAADNNGNVYLCGLFNKVPEKRLFLMKLNAENRPVWSFTMGGNGDDLPLQLKLHGNRLLFSGVFDKTGEFGANQLTSKGGSDLFILCASTDNGSIQWINNAGLEPETLLPECSYYATFSNEGTLLDCRVVPNSVGIPYPGLTVSRKDEMMVTGDFNEWGNLHLSKIEGVESFGDATTVSDELKLRTERQISQFKAEKGIAGIIALFEWVGSSNLVLSGEEITASIDRFSPDFKTECPDLYQNLGKIVSIEGKNGFVTISTLNGEDLSMDVIRVKDGSTLRTVETTDNNLKLEVIDGIKVGKEIVWFRLNHILLSRSDGDIVFDYGREHAKERINLTDDIL